MFHNDRIWCVSKVEDAEHLTHQLSGEEVSGWTLCTGFRLGDYLFLNDSTGEDNAQEYAVVKDMGDGTFRQVETYTVSWCERDRLLELIRQAVAGQHDTSAFAHAVRPRLETPANHGRCHLCM